MTRRRAQVYGASVRYWLREYRRPELPRYAKERAWANAMSTCELLNEESISDWGVATGWNGRQRWPFEVTYRGPRGGTRGRIHYRNGNIGRPR